jgi:hypothetical protein
MSALKLRGFKVGALQRTSVSGTAHQAAPWESQSLRSETSVCSEPHRAIA